MADDPPVAELRAALALLVDDPHDLDDGALGERVVALQRLRSRIDAAVVATTDVFDARATWALDGARNAQGWVAARTTAGYGTARRDVVTARALRSMPATRRAFASGRLGREQVDLLVRARGEGLEAAFDACEEVLVDEVARHTVTAGARFLRRWADEVRRRHGIGVPDGPEPAPEPERSRVHLSAALEGRWVLDGSLDAEDGEILTRAIDARVDAMWREGTFAIDDGLTTSERRAVALIEVVTRGTSGGDDDGSARPLVLGIVRLDPAPSRDGSDPQDALSAVPHALAHRRLPTTYGISEAARTGVVPTATLERWTCEGTLQLIGVGPGADQLHMGRAIRVANRAQRRALRIRDGSCTFPGCHADPDHCIAHHVTWWEHDGPTDLENLVLLCRHHHRAVHDRGFTMTRTDGVVEVRRPDGTPVTAPLLTRPDPALRAPPTSARSPGTGLRRAS